MRVAIADSQVAFFNGGAEFLAARLAQALRTLGHDVDMLRFPFDPSQPGAIERAIEFCAAEDLDRYVASPDVVIALRFPAYLLRHRDKRVWLLHQLRQYYEYYGVTAGSGNREAHDRARARIVAADTEGLGQATQLRALSRRVAQRLESGNGLRAQPLYSPLPVEQGLYSGRQDRYVYAPSRLEHHKRQWLLIEAMAFVGGDVKAVIGGEGGSHAAYAKRIEALGLGDRVLLAGRVEPVVHAAWYANSLAVFFGPEDEDYGYVTLEAMASAKPVITCDDSGGTLEFVLPGETGYVAAPEPRAIAACIEALAARPAHARALGEAGLARYRGLGLSWERTAAELLQGGQGK
jgi:glycosyltransferase involved in cell wall biosynthesis